MFWKKKIKCPIKQEDEMWITQHLEWLDENAVSLVDQPTFLPTKEYFDWTFTGSESDADFVLKQVGRYCRIITEGINLEFYSEESIELDRGLITQKEEGAGSAGMYVQNEGQFSILIDVQQLKKPLSLIATIAHELSHFILMGQRNIELEGVENEWLTDLLAIANGLVFLLAIQHLNLINGNQGMAGAAGNPPCKDIYHSKLLPMLWRLSK